jgi:hypothetical protein
MSKSQNPKRIVAKIFIRRFSPDGHNFFVLVVEYDYYYYVEIKTL